MNTRRLVFIAPLIGLLFPGSSAVLSVAQNQTDLMHKQIATLREMISAVNAGDARRYASLYAEGAVITIVGAGRLEGRAAIEQHEVDLLNQFPGTKLAFFAVWQNGPDAVVHYGVSGKTANGRPMGHEGLLFYRFAPSGAIAEERRYLDSLTPMSQIGLLDVPVRPVPSLPEDLKRYVHKGSADEQRNVAVVRTSFEALGAGDVESFISALADDIVLDDLMRPAAIEGKSDVRAWAEAWGGSPRLASEITRAIGADDFVLLEEIVRGTLRGPLGRLQPSNRPFTLHRGAIVRLSGQNIARIWCFANGKELAEAIGQWPLTR